MATLLPSNLTNQKHHRAMAIAQHVRRLGHERVVCFTCGNAAKALRNVGLDVVEVGPEGPLRTKRWWTPGEIAQAWPDRFDATSGHLPVWMMTDIGLRVLSMYPRLSTEEVYEIPTGSGETLCCLALANPRLRLVGVYDERLPETTYHSEAPLNTLTRALGRAVPATEV